MIHEISLLQITKHISSRTECFEEMAKNLLEKNQYLIVLKAEATTRFDQSLQIKHSSLHGNRSKGTRLRKILLPHSDAPSRTKVRHQTVKFSQVLLS